MTLGHCVADAGRFAVFFRVSRAIRPVLAKKHSKPAGSSGWFSIGVTCSKKCTEMENQANVGIISGIRIC